MTENVQEIIDRSDLPDSQKIGILIEKYALKPSSPRKIMTLTEKAGYFTSTFEGYYTDGNNFIRHGKTIQVCQCNKCDGKTTVLVQTHVEGTITQETVFRHGPRESTKIFRQFIGGTQKCEDVYYKDGNIKSRWYIGSDNTRIYKKFHKGTERFKYEGVKIKVGKPYVWDGRVTWYYQSGRIKRSGQYSRGTKIGKWKTVYPNGEKKSIIQYNEKGKAIGNLKEWYESGQLKRKENMLPNGVSVWYHENGQVECTGRFNKNDEKVGEWKWYNENGKEAKSANYKNGLKHGWFTEKTKKKAIDGTYRKGKKVGEWFIEYY